MNWLKRIFRKKKKHKNREVKVYSEHKKGFVFKSNNPKNDNVDRSDSLLVLSRPFGEAIWLNDSKQNKFNSPKKFLEEIMKIPQGDFEKEYLQKPDYTEEDRRFDDSHDKGIYSYPQVISEEREIYQSWIDDSYNSPSDSTSYDSSSSCDDSSTSSGDW